MAHFRLEAEYDVAARSYYVEVFYPAESTAPLIRTKAKFVSEDTALSETMLLIGHAFRKSVKPVKRI
jgi:hypothetical protein